MLPEVPGGTQLHLAQQVPHALLHNLGLDDNRHLAAQAPPQSVHKQHNNLNTLFTCAVGNFAKDAQNLINI